MKVLIGPNIMGLEKHIPELQAAFPHVEFAYHADRATLASVMGDVDIYFGWLGRDEFLAAKRVKWVQSPSTGVNYFLQIPELKQGRVILTGARGTHSAGLAESVFGMILAFTRGIRESVQLQPQHKWAMREVRAKLLELTGSTLGLVGFGALARATAKRAQAFDMRVVAVDPYATDAPGYVELWGMDRLNDLLKQSDYVVITVPDVPGVKGMIGAEQMALMKPSAMLIGISRGGIIEQKALAEALRAKRLWAAALDVTEPEPLPADSELWDIENLLICSHIAGGTQYESKYLMEIFKENLDKFLKGKFPLRNQVDKEKGF